MAIYICSRCDQVIDGDYDPCTEDPKNEFGLVCGSCAEEFLDEDGNLINEAP